MPPDLSCSLANALYAAVPPGRGGRLSNVLRSRTLDISPKNIKTRLSIAYLLGKFGVDTAENMDSKAVQRSALCRSRRELSNEYLLAKFGFDTAENEPI